MTHPVPKPAAPEDPAALVGVEVPAGELADMAACLVDEYVRLGLSDEAVLRVFRNPFFAGAHALWRAHGEARLRAWLAEARARWGWPRVRTEHPGEAGS
jgi:hypothetical protein